MNYPNSFKHYCHGKLGIAIASILLLLISFSCNRSGKSDGNNSKYAGAFSSAKKQALVFSTSNNDSAIIYADSAIKLMHKMDFKNTDTLFSLITIKVKAYQSKNNIDTAIVFLERCYKEAEDNSDVSLQAKIAVLIGGIELDEDNLYMVEKYIPKAIKLLEHQNDEYTQAMANGYYGVFLNNKGDYKKAIEYLLKAYKVFDKLNKYEDLDYISISIANNFIAIGSKKEGLRYYKIAVDAAVKLNDTANIMSALGNLGRYYRTKNPDSALYYYDKVIALKPAGSTPIFVVSAKYNKANIYTDKKEFDKALGEFNTILTETRLAKNYEGMSYAYSGMSFVYFSLKNKNLAIDCLQRAIKLADSIGKTSLKMSLKEQLQDNYKEYNNYKEAYLLAMEIKTFNDSTKSAEKQIAIHEMEANYQSEKKDLENKVLKSELERTNKVLIARSVIILLLLIVSFILALLLWRINVLNKQRQMAYDVLMKQYKHESEQRNENKEEEKIITIAPDVNQIQNDDFLLNTLNTYYETERPFHNAKLKIEDVSTAVNIPKRTLAKILNNNCNTNFNAFTNNYRVNEAKLLFEHRKYANYTIEAIAQEVGFGSRQSFYNAFEQVTGVKPTYYRDFICNTTHKPIEEPDLLP